MYRCSLSVSMLIVQNSNALLMTIIYMSRNEVTLANKSCFIWAWKEGSCTFYCCEPFGDFSLLDHKANTNRPQPFVHKQGDQ